VSSFLVFVVGEHVVVPSSFDLRSLYGINDGGKNGVAPTIGEDTVLTDSVWVTKNGAISVEH